MSYKLLLPVLVAAGITCFALPPQSNKPRAAPDTNAKMADPVQNNTTAGKSGQVLLMKNCQSSGHGKKGFWDGPRAAELRREASDFYVDEYRRPIAPGITYQVHQGRDKMPGFQQKLPDPGEIGSYIQLFKDLMNINVLSSTT